MPQGGGGLKRGYANRDEGDKDDPRVRAIHADIRRLYDHKKRTSCISDKEIWAYVEKYFLFGPILDHESHHRQREDAE